MHTDGAEGSTDNRKEPQIKPGGSLDALSAPNPHVVSNGTLIVDQDLQHLDYRLIDPGSFKAIVKFARKTGQLLLASTLDGDLLYEKTLQSIEHKHYMRKVEDLLAQEVTSQVLLATILRKQDCEPIGYHHIAPDKSGIKIRDAGFNYVNIFNRQAGKTFALKKVLGYLNLDSSQVMAIGDGQNDLGIIKMAGIGVAMGNACSQLKEAADFVTEDLDHDGLSKALSRVLGI
ncbi:MAG: HAD hydrolase family protein [Actinomycetota bacterium]|nr:HAD hydrolase family protein [Actinomycetota bacterium]